jgi:hypothetical protein
MSESDDRTLRACGGVLRVQRAGAVSIRGVLAAVAVGVAVVAFWLLYLRPTGCGFGCVGGSVSNAPRP